MKRIRLLVNVKVVSQENIVKSNIFDVQQMADLWINTIVKKANISNVFIMVKVRSC